jgi:branched-chain amino acid transport system ATP-binding protein
MTPLLSLEGVHTHIGQYHILHGVDFAVPQGELTMLLGRNGAGKTTTLRTIMGLWRASSGRVLFEGADIAGRPTPSIAAAGIAYVPENMGIFTDLTVAENMTLAARAARHAGEIDTTRLEWIFSLFPALKKFWASRAGVLSGGQKQMLAVARAIVEPRKLLLIDEPTKGLAPAIIGHMIEAFGELKKSGATILLVEQNFNFARKLLLIDEPTKGLAPAIIGHMIEAFGELKKSGATILLVEQNFNFARKLGDSVAVMDDGRVVHRGSMRELAEDEALQSRLLGLSLAAHQ